MIRFENVETYGWEAAVRGMRNPKNSWGKSDSVFSIIDGHPHLGSNDKKLMATLREAGTDHRKFMRMIVVSMDITAPLYWWAEFDTYKVGTVRNSCSKMHKLLEKPFEMNDFSFDKLPGYRNEVKQFPPEADEETEVWCECVIDKGYHVSDCGRIRHNMRVLSGTLHQDGYVFVTIKGKQYPIHRLVAQHFVSNPDNKPEVNHKDGNKQNNQASNLEWVTRGENVTHAIRTGLQPNPVHKYKGKFSPEKREEIKALWDAGESKRKLAKMYGVSHTCICDIVNDKYKYAEKVNLYEEVARPWIDMLNELRDSYMRCLEEGVKKEIWYAILQLLPESYNQRATVLLNYEVLANIYKSRRNHKLAEWHAFCDWIETLPYSWLITGKEDCSDE